MFTRRSVLVGLLVLLAVRLVSAAVNQRISVDIPPPPPPPAYLQSDGLASQARLPGLGNWLTQTNSLGGSAFDFPAVNPSNSAYEVYPEGSVTVDVLSANWSEGNGSGNLARFVFADPRRVWDVDVNTCRFDGGVPGGETGFSGDTLPGAFPGSLTQTLAVIGSPGADLVQVIGTPSSGEMCDLTNIITGTSGSFFGLGVEITETWSQKHLWVRRGSTTADPALYYGALDVYALNAATQPVQLTHLDSYDGTVSSPLYPAVLTEWCSEPWTGRCDALVGVPSSNEAGISAFTVVNASTISRVGGVNIPGANQLGRCIAEAGDLNGDFVPDIWGCAQDKLFAISGKDLKDASGGIIGAASIIHEIPAPETGAGFPHAILANFHYNDDYVPDVIASAPYASPFSKQHAGAVYIFDGATGTLLRMFDGPAPGDQLGNTRNPFLLLGGVGPPDGIPSLGVVSPFHSPGRGLQRFITGTAGGGDILMVFSRDPSPLTRFLALFSPLRPMSSHGPGIR